MNHIPYKEKSYSKIIADIEEWKKLLKKIEEIQAELKIIEKGRIKHEEEKYQC